MMKFIFTERKVDLFDEVKAYAVQTWLSSVVNAVNILTFFQNDEAMDTCIACRKTLCSNYSSIKYLIRRQRFAAWLIIISPGIHRAIYRIYKKRS